MAPGTVRVEVLGTLVPRNLLIGFSAAGRPIAGMDGARKQRRRRIVAELNDEGEHQADEVAVLGAEVEAKNRANICLMRLYAAGTRNVAQRTGLGGVDRLTRAVIG